MPLPSSIPVPQVRFGKRKERSQMWEMYTDDGRIRDIEIDVLLGCCDDVKHGKGFLLDVQNQYTDERGYWVQVGWDRSLMPLCMIEETKILGTQNKPGVGDDDEHITLLVDQLYHEAKEKTQEIIWSKVSRNTAMDKIIWLITIPCVTALIAFAMVWIKK